MLVIGVDVGGTFTDVACLVDGETIYCTKVPTRPKDIAGGVLAGLSKALRLAGQPPQAVQRVVHGTTVATNAVVQRKGAITGLLATQGFEDVLEIGRLKRSRMYDLMIDAQTPVFIAPRRQRVGIRERIGPRGEVLEPLNENDVVAAVTRLRQEFGVQAIAVSYLFSFQNPAHEVRTREIIKEQFPGIAVSISSEVHPLYREYERTCVTAFDAYLRPVMEEYLLRLEAELQRQGFGARLQIMQSRGGITSAGLAVLRPVHTFLSGPAAGVLGGKFAGEQARSSELITLDMGGTSNDVALVTRGKPLITTETRILDYPVPIPMVDVHTIGAGGGSLAWVDSGGGLQVGPESAGADPGPVCYGKGGTQPTVTDANLLLGYLNPDYFAGGEMQLDRALAEQALAALGERLGFDAMATAAGIHRIINARMADQIRLLTVRRGYDPRQFTLLAMGGAGPVHAGALAADLGISRVIVPAAPGVLSAFGLLVANVEHEHSRTYMAPASQADQHRMEALYRELTDLGLAALAREGLTPAMAGVSRLADMRYRGQAFELQVPVPPGPMNQAAIAAAVEGFHELYAQIYGHCSREDEVEFVTLRAVCTYAPPRPPTSATIDWRADGGGGRGERSLAAASKAPRQAYFSGTLREVPTYERGSLPADEPIVGPAVIEQPDTTVVIYPDQVAHVDTAGNLILEVRTDS